MKLLRILLLAILPMFVFAQNESGDIVLNLEGLRKDIKDNGYNAEEIDYYDDRDNLVYTITYDSKGELEETPMGIAIIKREYDETSNLIQKSYYDENKKPFRTEFSGPAIIKYKYDEKGNKVETNYCDEKGQSLSNGFAIITYDYDKNGNIIEKHYFDSNRKLTNNICIFKYKYDQNGRKIEESKHDNSEQLIKTDDNYKNSIIRYKYDKDDRLIERTFYDENNELIEGETRIVYDYTQKPDIKEKPGILKDLLNKENFDWVEQVFYDKNGNEIKRNFQYMSK
ncbi:MAG: hypothetical protein ACQETL_07480 [Bacteroidota bacterium]